MPKLNKDNYHSLEANRQYMSCSLFKSFLPQYGGCEARAMAVLNGEWEEKESNALLVGRYVHAWNEGKLGEFIDKNYSDIYTRTGALRADFILADKMIATLRNDPLITKAREGEKEVIMTGELFGMPWKVMIDIYNPELKVFADLKTCREIHRTEWNPVTRRRENMIELYGYDWQMAIYAEIEWQNRPLAIDYFQPHIIAVSKEDPPDKEIIHFGTEFIPEVLSEMKLFAGGVQTVWSGRTEPLRCDRCDYCRATKQLTRTVFYMDL